MKILSVLKKGLALTALSVTFAFATPPDGSIEINYHRPDGNYTGWGVHLWKSPNMPLPDIEWSGPMEPTGKNAFGVYWHVKLDEFSTGSKSQVNYIIHRGDIKEQGGKDMSFNGLQHKQIWVWAKDSETYFSYADVKANHPDAPAE